MASLIDRRTWLKGTAAALVAPALAPTRAFAQTDGLTPYQRRIAAAARTQTARVSQHLWQKDRVGIADFALPSSLPRLHFVNLESGTVKTHLVAHGIGSDPQGDGWLKQFSNVVNSRATSRGAYLTGSWYLGKYGMSIRLYGIDPDCSNADPRAIVMHPAWYAAPDMLAKWGKLGRSDGCFAMSPLMFAEALYTLAGGRMLFADKIGEA